MKKIDMILGLVFVLLTAIIVNYSAYPLWVNVSNYENLLPPSGSIVGVKTLLSGFPLYMMIAILVSTGFYLYKALVLKQNDAFARKHYSILGIVFGVIGVATSILSGTWIYHTFVGPYMFDAYPLFMLIVHVLFVAMGVYCLVRSLKEIKANNLKKEHKSSFVHVLFTIGEVGLTLFALGRLGAFLTQPVYWSKYDSIYVLPYIIQLLAPAAILVCYLLNRDFIKNKKFGLIATISIIGYSILSMIYMIVLVDKCGAGTHAANSTMYINPLSQIQNPGRLLTGPINETIMYVVSIAIPLSNLIILLVKKIIEKVKK